jgi:hypothetical protein
MENEPTEIHASADDAFWPGWGPCRHFKDLEPSRELPAPGSSVELRVKCPAVQECVLAIVFQAPVPRATVDALQLQRDGKRYPLHFRSEVPYLAYAFFPQQDATAHASNTGLRLVVDGAAPHSASVLYLAAMALPGMRSSKWLSPIERLRRLLPANVSARAEEDFPYSHFDGVEYLEKNPDVKDAILARRCSSALSHYLKFGRKEGRRINLATRSTPNPGSLLNLGNRLRSQAHAHWTEGRAVSQENDLLLLQLHQVQEELEEYFLANRKLQESQHKLAALESEHSELVNRHSSLVAERDATAKERDDALKEQNTLKKTISDSAMRIGKLEAQAVDQAERQKQLDEEMVKAEAQLEMLKELLRPEIA